ncbi:MAG: phage major capsid protein [Planctomycetota bacterium]|nr:phage major capsid protein [Planctomycetota bacterium]
MAQQTLSNYDAMLKEFYLPPVIDAFPKTVDLYDEFVKDTESWEGNKVIQPIRANRNFGRGARADGGTMPTAGRQTPVEHQVSCKFNYQRIEITGPTMKASRSNDGAFTKAMTFEMNHATKDLLDDIDRQMGSTGIGTIGVVEGAVSNATTVEVDYAGASSSAVTAEPGTRWIKKDMVLNIGTAAEHVAGTVVNCTVDSVTDRDTFVTTANVTLVDNDIIVQAGAAAAANSSYNNEIEGLTAAMITTGTYQNITVTTYPQWKANVLTASANRTLTWDLMQQSIDEAEEGGGGRIDLIVAHVSMRREYLDMILNDKRYSGTKGFDAGHEGQLSFNGIKMKFCRNFPYNSLMFCDRSTWALYVQGGVDWFDWDGSVLHRTSNADAVEALLTYYANLGCSLPSANTWLKDITVTLRST